ncbi:MAG: sulfatase, partial [Planctomycetota bacterium]
STMVRNTCLVLAFVVCAARAAADERPNFVFLVTEDNSKHFLRLYDPEHGAPMPNIERLARRGLVFNHAFSNAPVCSTARTTLATGCFGPRIGTQFHRRARMAPMPQGLEMFTAYLRRAGYYASNNAKTDYNAAAGEVWDESSRKASWRARKPGQPFFHMQSFGVTHESSLHFGLDQLQKPTVTDAESVGLSARHPDTPLFRYTYARYGDQHQAADAQMGRVIEQLRSDGLMDDTFVFYFGDHGGVLPGSKGYLYETGLHIPLVVSIPRNFEHLIDATPGTRINGFVSFVDFGPTVLHLAGLDPPARVDGRPFLGPGIERQDVDRRQETFGYADRFDEKYDLVRSYRRGRFKYVRNYQPFNVDGLFNAYRYRMAAYRQWRDMHRAGELTASQRLFFEPRSAESLYDVASDPYEVHDLAGDPAHAETLGEMRRRLVDWVKSMPDLSFIPEPRLVDRPFDDPVSYGQVNKGLIGELVDIADLQLESFNAAQPRIEAALDSSDPVQRYWGLIVCTAFGADAASLANKARAIVATDEDGLVRTRAAEFLALAADFDPTSVLQSALAASQSRIEAILILNTAALLRDVPPYRTFEFTPPPGFGEDEWVSRRIDYLKP